MAALKNSKAFGGSKRISSKDDVNFDLKRKDDDWGQFD